MAKRPPPRLTEAQARSVAEYSRVQPRHRSRDEVRRADEDWKAERKERQPAFQAKMDREFTWLARIIVIPLSLLVLGIVAVLVSGLWSGEIHEAGKNAKGYVTREAWPVRFWVTAVFHALTIAAFGYLAVSAWKKTGWLRRRPKSRR